VWLMDPTDKNLVALGVLGVDGRGAYLVPAGLDLSHYTAVDVSLQPMNGSPLHSSVSAVRGIIQT
jgi:anti-sigma-K factor RskA